jgi:hypothetical protein
LEELAKEAGVKRTHLSETIAYAKTRVHSLEKTSLRSAQEADELRGLQKILKAYNAFLEHFSRAETDDDEDLELDLPMAA